jgi:hypothetical protein
MNKKLKRAFYLYQKSMWFFGIAAAEARKPLTLWNETALITIFLSTVLGYKPPFLGILIVYIFLSLMAILIGRLLVKTGVVAFNARLGNQQSPELIEILDRIKKIGGKDISVLNSKRKK